jgi:uncharacterized protein
VNICILGATGRVGSFIVTEALKEGHTIQALARKESNISVYQKNIKWIIGNALNQENLNKTMAGTDIVVSSLNTDGNGTLSSSMPLIIRSMEKHEIKRIITIGTAGILQSRVSPKAYRFQSPESRNRSTKAAEDHLSAYLKLKASGLDWTVICPTYLPDGKPTGKYRTEKDYLPKDGLSISTGDTGEFAFKQLFSKQFLHCRVGLAY